MEKENIDINEIISHQNIIQDKALSEKIELKLQKEYNISIPSIILEYIPEEKEKEKEENPSLFELENLKNFFNNFGEVLNIVIAGKKVIVLFKTFFIAHICKRFLEQEKYFHEGKKAFFNVRWFDFLKDSDLLIENIKLIFEKIYYTNIVNIKPEMKDMNNLLRNNNNMNNKIGIKMNMNMNINNFNINTTMNPLGQNHNIFPNMNNFGMNQMGINLNNLNIQQQQYLQQLMKMNKNINFNNVNQVYLMQLIQAQNALKNNINNNKINNINNLNNINNNINTNPLLNKNLQILSQMNPQLLQKQFKNYNQMQNNNIINNNNINPNNINNTNMINNEINNSNINSNSSNDEKNFGKYTCKYEILIANDKDFQIARRLIGKQGCNMKNIINECKSSPSESDKIKLRLRGRGSGYKEGPDNKESDEPLHLCISSKSPEDMKKACLLVDDLLNKIHEDYKDYCQKNNVAPINTEIAMRIESKNLGFNNTNGK